MLSTRVLYVWILRLLELNTYDVGARFGVLEIQDSKLADLSKAKVMSLVMIPCRWD